MCGMVWYCTFLPHGDMLNPAILTLGYSVASAVFAREILNTQQVRLR